MTDHQVENTNPEPEYEKPFVRTGLEQAFESMFECDENATMEQRFDALLQVAWANSFYLLDRQRIYGKKPSDAEIDFQEQCDIQLKRMEKYFSMARKHGRIGNNPNDNFGTELVVRIQKRRGSLGDIVRDVPVHPKKEGQGE